MPSSSALTAASLPDLVGCVAFAEEALSRVVVG